jgi:hypothetical protein
MKACSIHSRNRKKHDGILYVAVHYIGEQPDFNIEHPVAVSWPVSVHCQARIAASWHLSVRVRHKCFVMACYEYRHTRRKQVRRGVSVHHAKRKCCVVASECTLF